MWPLTEIGGTPPPHLAVDDVIVLPARSGGWAWDWVPEEAGPVFTVLEGDGGPVETVSLKRRRNRSTAWRSSAPVHSNDVPFEVCLEADQSLSDLISVAGLYTECIAVMLPETWHTSSTLMRDGARTHSLYPVVVTGDTGASKKCTQAAMRRLETIWEWAASLEDTSGATVSRQVRYGESRQRGRKLRKTPPTANPCRVAPPLHLEELLMRHDCSVDSAVVFGSSRTLRVFDVTGECVWLVPISTLVAVGLFARPEHVTSIDYCEEFSSTTL